MKTKLLFMALGLLVLSTLLFTGCWEDSAQHQEYNLNNDQLAKFQANQPIPQIEFSNTRQAVIDRINRWSDPNKISYIYLCSFGRVMAFYTVKGSVECKQSYLSPVLKPMNPNYNESSIVDAPDIDGTYGDNMDSIFFFTTEGVYVEWHGDYMWTDQPLKFTTAPELYMEVK